MFREISDFFREFCGGHEWGNPESFVLPTAIYISNAVIVIRDRDELKNLLERYNAALSSTGFSREDFRINSISQATSGKLCVAVTAFHADKAGRSTNVTDITCFFRSMDGKLKLELIEIVRSSEPLKNPYYRALFEGPGLGATTAKRLI